MSQTIDAVVAKRQTMPEKNRFPAVLVPESQRAASVMATLDGSYGRLQGCSGQDAGHGHSHLITASCKSRRCVRRVTPRETERLQGFPDDWTLIPKRKPLTEEQRSNVDMAYVEYLARGGRLSLNECMNAAADNPRYKAIGNSWAVPCARWIGKRLTEAMKCQ